MVQSTCSLDPAPYHVIYTNISRTEQDTNPQRIQWNLSSDAICRHKMRAVQSMRVEVWLALSYCYLHPTIKRMHAPHVVRFSLFNVPNKFATVVFESELNFLSRKASDQFTEKLGKRRPFSVSEIPTNKVNTWY